MMVARLANIPDPNNFDDPDKLRNLMANAHRLGRGDLAAGSGVQRFDEYAATIAKTKLLDNGVDKMTIEGWLNGQG